MTAKMVPYIVREGDYLWQLAFRLGFDATEVWGHAKNETLRKLRANPEVMCAGDLLWIPSHDDRPKLPIKAGQSNRCRAKVPTVQVHLALKDRKGEPMANEPFRIEGDGLDALEGTSDGDGMVSADVPVHAQNVILTLPGRHFEMDITVGVLDPVEEVSRPDRDEV